MGDDEKDRHSAFMSALTTEHFVLQTASSSTVSESAARASIYVLSLSSSLVAMGFASQSREAFGPFLAAVLPALFLLGIFTVIRLVDITVEHQELKLGPAIALLTTTGTMVAFINGMVAGAGVTLLARALLGPPHILRCVLLGLASAAAHGAIFLAYQQWRFKLGSRDRG